MLAPAAASFAQQPREAAPRREPTLGEVEEQLRSLQEARSQPSAPGLRWQDGVRLPVSEHGIYVDPRSAVVEIGYNAEGLTAAAIFTPVDPQDGEEARSIRALIGGKGREYVRLWPSQWEVRIVVSDAAGFTAELARRTVRVTGGQGYRLRFEEPEETEGRRALNLAKKSRQPAPGAQSNPSDSAPIRRAQREAESRPPR